MISSLLSKVTLISKRCGWCRTEHDPIEPIVFEVLEEHFGERILAMGYPECTGIGITYPPYSTDLNPCDSFLWGNIKDKVYANNPKTIAELKTAIQEVIESIDVSTLQRVLQNFAIRLRHIIAIDGKHIEHVIN